MKKPPGPSAAMRKFNDTEAINAKLKAQARSDSPPLIETPKIWFRGEITTAMNARDCHHEDLEFKQANKEIWE